MEKDTAESGVRTGVAFCVCPQTVAMTFADDSGAGTDGSEGCKKRFGRPVEL